MTEEYVDELDDALDDVEPVVENPSELYEHFRVVVDKGQSQVRVDKYLFERLGNSSRHRIPRCHAWFHVRAAGHPPAHPHPEGCRRRPHHGERQTGEKQL